MRYFREQRRKQIVNRLTNHLAEDKKRCMRVALLLTFTDKQLHAMDEILYFRRRRLWNLPEIIMDKLDKKDTFEPDSKAFHHIHEVYFRIEELVNYYCELGHTPVYTVHLKSLAAAIDRVKTKYGDPSKDGYQSAMNSGAEIVMDIQTTLKVNSHNLTAAQEEGIAAVMFLLRQSGEDEFAPISFVPVFEPKDTSIYRWMTEKILRSPEDAEGNLAAFLQRRKRSEGIASKLGKTNHEMYDYDGLCDYPDEAIDRLAKIQEDDYRLGEEVSRYVVMEGHSYQTMNEVLCFMGPYRSQFNIRYLAGTIPSVLRAYKSLPHMDDYSNAPEVVRDQCAALLRVSIAISTELEGGAAVQEALLNHDRTIKDQRLIDLLMDHPERGDEIAAIIKERQTADYDTINEVTGSVIGEGNL